MIESGFTSPDRLKAAKAACHCKYGAGFSDLQAEKTSAGKQPAKNPDHTC